MLDDNFNVINTFTSVENLSLYIKIDAKLIRNSFNDKMDTIIIEDYIIRYKYVLTLENEIWKNVNTEYCSINEIYQASSFGRIKNKNSSRILTTNDEDKYQEVVLYDSINKIKTKRKVHRLVAFAFLSYTDLQSDYQVNHINKYKSDNHVSNLELLSSKEHNRIDKGNPLLALSVINNKYIIFRSQIEASEILEFNVASISFAIINNKKYKDYYWFHLNSIDAQEYIKKYQQDETIKGQLIIKDKQSFDKSQNKNTILLPFRKQIITKRENVVLPLFTRK